MTSSQDKEELTFEEFTKVMRGYEQDLENAKLGKNLYKALMVEGG